ncbi:MAG: hypothetical protein FK734_09280 [Asgard group archaeon]|nr:hypothetical protein [Asgard group archaeon]
MKSQDVITYNQLFLKNVTDVNVAKYFYDENYLTILKLLRNGPATIDDMDEAYKQSNNPKSNKTLYRYIKTLEEDGLIVEAGKRIITDDNNKNRSVTIYMRTAKVFMDFTHLTDSKIISDTRNKQYNTMKLILEKAIEDKEIIIEKFSKFIVNIYSKGLNQLEEITEKHKINLLELLGDCEFFEISNFIDDIVWLILLVSSDIKSDLLDCFEDKA